MNYTQVRITIEYRDKLKTLADKNRRTMAQQLMKLIDDHSHEALSSEPGLEVSEGTLPGSDKESK